MAQPTFNVLLSTRLTAMVEALQDIRNLPAELLFLSRTPITPAVDAEILGRFIAYVFISDVIADDQAATTYSTGKMQFEASNIPNIKHGVNVNQSMLNLLVSIANGSSLGVDVGLFDDYLNTQMDNILLGIRERMEQMIAGMLMDTWSYDRFGIKVVNASWGMPSDLKVTSAVGWDVPATATPVTDVWTLRNLAEIRYGKVFNRLTMSRTAFDFMVKTTEFKDQAKIYLPIAGMAAGNLPLLNFSAMMPMAEAVLGMNVEIYNGRYWQQSTTGAIASAPFLPVTKVIMSSSADDNNRNVMDFGSGIVTETLVGGAGPNAVVGGMPGPRRGPIAYATTPPDLNPPNITLWGVARGFPRKRQLQGNAVMTVGSFSDPVPTTPPF